MAPRKRRKYDRKGQQSRQSVNRLLDLPLPALALIYQHCDVLTRGALLRVSAGCRDVVLGEATSIKFRANQHQHKRRALARLLHRACNLAAGSLTLSLDLKMVDHGSTLLADLLQPGIQQSGWASVAKLVLRGSLDPSTPAKLVSAAFPALQRLELVKMRLNWEDLHALTSCSQLSCLCLERCALQASAAATNPLAALASLKELHELRTSGTMTQGLTQLTSLRLHTPVESMSRLIMSCLDVLQQLRQLDLQGNDYQVPATVPAQLFSVAPNLTGLTLFTATQQTFDALLAHATQLTRLTCCHLHLSEDRSQSACSWKELVVTGACCAPRMLANLPLHSLSRVSLGAYHQIPSACPSVRCMMNTPLGLNCECRPEEIQAAFSNLQTCPAWQASGPSVHVCLTSEGRQQTVGRLMQYLSALAAAASRKVQLRIAAPELELAREVIEHLGTTFGHSLTHLSLHSCTIHHDFWPAVWRHLPGLHELKMLIGVEGAVSSSDIAAFCSHATRPLSLRLGMHLHSSVGPAEQLEQQCRTWGAPQVTVIKDNDDL